MVVVTGAGAGTAAGAGLAAGADAIGATGGSTLGEHAANSARHAKGVISTKRLRVGVCIWGFLVWSGLSFGCRGAIARHPGDALTWSASRSHVACGSGSVSVRQRTLRGEVTDDRERQQSKPSKSPRRRYRQSTDWFRDTQ
jgi:hypothetical protein